MTARLIPHDMVRRYFEDQIASVVLLQAITTVVFEGRVTGWSHGPAAQNLDPHRTSPPNVVDEDGFPIPQVSDPTATAALASIAGDTLRDFGDEFFEHAAHAAAARTWLAELARSIDADGTDLEASIETATKLVFGECEVCEKKLRRGAGTGIDNKHPEFLHYVEEHTLCATHKRNRSKKTRSGGHGLTIDEFITHARAVLLAQKTKQKKAA